MRTREKGEKMTFHAQFFGAITALTVITGLLGAVPAKAEHWSLYKQWDFAKPAFVHDLPFAKHKVVLQVSQGDVARWNLALNNASNVLQIFGQGKVRVVIVAYGPGLKMLFAKTPVAARLQSLDAEGVEFDACHQTMLNIKRATGHLPKLVPQAAVVPGGVVRIMQLEEHGFDYLKP
jgi:intracellular sulfur oxidation DsrE/DsrF family protein